MPKKAAAPIPSSLKEYATASVSRDISKLEKKLEKLTKSITNHSVELELKKTMHDELEKQLTELKTIRENIV